MVLNRIELRNFRNYGESEAVFSRGINLLIGENGQGKSNLLEALFFVTTAHSFRTRRDTDLIQWGKTEFSLHLKATDSMGQDHSQGVSISNEGQKKTSVNGNPSGRLLDLFGRIQMVAFCPSDIELIEGAQATRRRFLNLVLSQLSPEYLLNLRKYNRVLQQRNSLLKGQERWDEEFLDVLDDQISEVGSKILRERMGFLSGFTASVTHFFKDLSHMEELSTDYHKTIGTELGPEPISGEQYKQALINLRWADKKCGHTTAGPHRDSLFFHLDKKEAGEFASQGQKRLIALSLKFATAKILEQFGNQSTILLLDDVFAELDNRRREYLSESILLYRQVFCATPRAEDLPLCPNRIVEVKEGTLIEKTA